MTISLTPVGRHESSQYVMKKWRFIVTGSVELKTVREWKPIAQKSAYNQQQPMMMPKMPFASLLHVPVHNKIYINQQPVRCWLLGERVE